MSRMSIREPSLSFSGLFHIIMPFVKEVFGASALGYEASLVGKHEASDVPANLFAKSDLPELTGPTSVTIESF